MDSLRGGAIFKNWQASYTNATCKELTSNSHKSATEELNVGRRGEEEIYTYVYFVARRSPTSSNESQETMLIHFLNSFAATLQNAQCGLKLGQCDHPCKHLNEEK